MKKRKHNYTQAHFHKKSMQKSLPKYSFVHKQTIYSQNPQDRYQKITKTQQQNQKNCKYPPEYYFDKQTRKKYCISVIDKFFCDKIAKIPPKRQLIKTKLINPFIDEDLILYNAKNDNEQSNKDSENNKYVNKLEDLDLRDLPQIQQIKDKQRKSKSAVRRSVTVPDMDQTQPLDDNQILSKKFRNFRNTKFCNRDHKTTYYQQKSELKVSEIPQQKKVSEIPQTIYKNLKTIYQNNGYIISSYQPYKNNKIHYKKYKDSKLGLQLQSRNQKIHKQFGIPSIWSNCQYHQYVKTIHTKNLRQSLFSIRKKQTYDPEDRQLIITPKQIYKKLFLNQCQYIFDIVRSICKSLLQVKDRAICLQISLDNIYCIQEKDYRIGQWGSSALKKQFGVGKQKMYFYNSPLIQDINGYILHPEYIAPQILQMISISNRVDGQILSQSNWQAWSLGLIIYELYCMIPVWLPFKAKVNNNIASYGFLYTKNRTLNNIIEKQTRFPFQILKWIKKQRNTDNYKILDLMKDMVNLDSSRRPSLQNIIQRCKI